MPDLVPVDHQPEFDHSLVAVNHNPFDYSGVGAAMPEAYGASAPVTDPLAKLVIGAGKSAISGVTAPGDAYAGRLDPMSDEGMRRTMDMAGLMTLGAGAGPAEANSLRAGIKAFHGSPHDFDKFSMDKIGTGEGAQAYGHGLYFAEAEPVAKQYRDQLKWKGADFNEPHNIAQNAIDRHNGDREAAVASLESAVESTKRFHRGNVPPAQAKANADVEQAIAHLRSGDPITGSAPTPGHMYEVNINADPEHFLDWDKPLSEQHPKVRDAVSSAMLPSESFKGPLKTRAEAAKAGDFSGIDGASALKLLGDYSNPSAASQALRNAGIPGIKYLDQGSRTAGEGSRNYVVFNHDLIDIVKKYAVAGIALPPAIAAQYKKNFVPVDHDPFEGE